MNDEITRDGVHLYSELDEYLNNKRDKVQWPDNVTIKDYCLVRMREQTRKARQTGIIDHILDGD